VQCSKIFIDKIEIINNKVIYNNQE
jgi:hypothetical protein